MRLISTAKRILDLLKRTYVNVTIAQIVHGQILKDKHIVITGGSRGLGLAMAKKFISEGAIVLITGHNQDNLNKAMADIASNRLHTVLFDSNDIDGIPAFMTSCFDKFGTVDALVSNAGISLHETGITEVTPNGFDKPIATNLKSHYFMSKSYIEQKIKEYGQPGNLLFITSKDGYVCGEIPYPLTKAAINSLVGGLSAHYYRKGIRVNAIAPGVTITDMTSSYAKKADGNMSAENYAGRHFLPEEVAEVAAFLLSDASKCISGQIIFTDGGSHIKSNIK